jgi:hypothetical protein
MTVVAEKEQAGKEVRWSIRRKTDAVMRLLRGEDLDTVPASSGSRPRSVRCVLHVSRDGLQERANGWPMPVTETAGQRHFGSDSPCQNRAESDR